MRAHLAIASILLACVFGPMASAQADLEVDVELVIAVDVSRSMTPRELEIQRRGYAEALVSKEVIEAIRNGFLGQVAITYVEWSRMRIVDPGCVKTPHSHRNVVVQRELERFSLLCSIREHKNSMNLSTIE